MVLQRFNKNTTRSELEFYLIDTIKIRRKYIIGTIPLSWLRQEASPLTWLALITIKRKIEIRS